MARKKWIVIPGGRIKRWRRARALAGLTLFDKSRRTGTETC